MRFAWPFLAVALFCGCPDDPDGGEPVVLRFAAVAGAEPFQCGGTYAGIGTTGSELTTSDLRFYVHDVRLVTADGGEVPVRLDQDGMWQAEDVALLDFEDGSASCEGGNPELNMEIRGRAPPGDYTGVRFVLGVPFALNHADPTAAPPPLNLTSMFWSWMAGYKFLRFDGASTGQPDGLRVHLGSTGCDGDVSGNVTACASPNRSEVSLDGFDPETSVVVADLAMLFGTSDIDANADGTPPGCMGGPDDDDCGPVLESLGLPYGGAGGGSQTFFRVE